MGTGETVAVKQVKLADLPKSEIRVITVSIPCPILMRGLANLDFLLSSRSISSRIWMYVRTRYSTSGAYLQTSQHPNIVKYRGFVKSAESLNIILEYVTPLDVLCS